MEWRVWHLYDIQNVTFLVNLKQKRRFMPINDSSIFHNALMSIIIYPSSHAFWRMYEWVQRDWLNVILQGFKKIKIISISLVVVVVAITKWMEFILMTFNAPIIIYKIWRSNSSSKEKRDAMMYLGKWLFSLAIVYENECKMYRHKME